MDTKTAFLIQYFRRELDSPSSGDGVDFYVFKDPVEQDLSETFQDEIVMKLPVPSFFFSKAKCISPKLCLEQRLFVR